MYVGAVQLGTHTCVSDRSHFHLFEAFSLRALPRLHFTHGADYFEHSNEGALKIFTGDLLCLDACANGSGGLIFKARHSEC